ELRVEPARVALSLDVDRLGLFAPQLGFYDTVRGDRRRDVAGARSGAARAAGRDDRRRPHRKGGSDRAASAGAGPDGGGRTGRAPAAGGAGGDVHAVRNQGDAGGWSRQGHRRQRGIHRRDRGTCRARVRARAGLLEAQRARRRDRRAGGSLRRRARSEDRRQGRLAQKHARGRQERGGVSGQADGDLGPAGAGVRGGGAGARGAAVPAGLRAARRDRAEAAVAGGGGAVAVGQLPPRLAEGAARGALTRAPSRGPCIFRSALLAKTQTLTVLGCGTMGEAIVRGILRSGRLEPAQIFATDRRAEVVKALREKHAIRTTSANREAARAADVVVVCVKQHEVGPLLRDAEIGKSLAGKLVISIAAGIRLDQLASWLPGSAVVRAM